ncbi:MAG: hypothetical protein OXG97_01240 [Candidatus Poribacteria bacterium]|nr:hypothetical protein [Candidatus Poribacteria bacterium]
MVGTEQSAELEQRFIAYLHNIEKEKLYYFILAHEQGGNVLIVNAPSKNREQKQFLGYWWSEAKGREGIKYEGGAKTVNDIITPLFDPKDLDNDRKINTAIKLNFIGETIVSLSEYCRYAKLTDMLNFSRVDFDKIISLNPQQNIETQWPLVKLGDEIETIETGNRPEGGVENISGGAWSLGGEHIHPTTGMVNLSTPKYVPLDFYHGSSRGILQENDILLCEAIDQEADQARQTITNSKQRIEEVVSSVGKTSMLNEIVDRVSDIINPKEENGSVYYVGLENIESQTGALQGNPQSDFSMIKSNKNVFRKGDILYGKLRPNLNKVHLAQGDGICSTDILVFRPYNPNLAAFYKHYFLSEEFNSEVVKTVSGQQLPRTSWKKINRILVPSLDIPQQLVAEVEQLEAEIIQAQAVINNATVRKNAILAKYL